MKYSHIGAVVVENIRIYHDLGYILVVCDYLQHKSFGMPTEESKTN